MRFDAEALERVAQTGRIFPHFGRRVDHALPAQCEQRDGREGVFLRGSLCTALNLLRDLGGAGLRLTFFQLLRVLGGRRDGNGRSGRRRRGRGGSCGRRRGNGNGGDGLFRGLRLRVMQLDLVDRHLLDRRVARGGLLLRLLQIFVRRLDAPSAFCGLFLLQVGRIVDGKVNVRGRVLALIALDALVCDAVDQTLRRVDLRLVVEAFLAGHTGAVLDGGDQAADRDAHTRQNLQDHQKEQRDQGTDLHNRRFKNFCNQAGEQAAARPVLTALIERADLERHVVAGEKLIDDVNDRGNGQNERQRGHNTQPDRLSPAQKQEHRRVDQQERQYVAADLAEQPADQRGARRDQERVGIDIAQKRKQRQNNADHAGKLTPVLHLLLLRGAGARLLRGALVLVGRFRCHGLTPLQIDK